MSRIKSLFFKGGPFGLPNSVYTSNWPNLLYTPSTSQNASVYQGTMQPSIPNTSTMAAAGYDMVWTNAANTNVQISSPLRYSVCLEALETFSFTSGTDKMTVRFANDESNAAMNLQFAAAVGVSIPNGYGGLSHFQLFSNIPTEGTLPATTETGTGIRVVAFDIPCLSNYTINKGQVFVLMVEIFAIAQASMATAYTGHIYCTGGASSYLDYKASVSALHNDSATASFQGSLGSSLILPCITVPADRFNTALWSSYGNSTGEAYPYRISGASSGTVTWSGQGISVGDLIAIGSSDVINLSNITGMTYYGASTSSGGAHNFQLFTATSTTVSFSSATNVIGYNLRNTYDVNTIGGYALQSGTAGISGADSVSSLMPSTIKNRRATTLATFLFSTLDTIGNCNVAVEHLAGSNNASQRVSYSASAAFSAPAASGGSGNYSGATINLVSGVIDATIVECATKLLNLSGLNLNYSFSIKDSGGNRPSECLRLLLTLPYPTVPGLTYLAEANQISAAASSPTQFTTNAPSGGDVLYGAFFESTVASDATVSLLQNACYTYGSGSSGTNRFFLAVGKENGGVDNYSSINRTTPVAERIHHFSLKLSSRTMVQVTQSFSSMNSGFKTTTVNARMVVNDTLTVDLSALGTTATKFLVVFCILNNSGTANVPYSIIKHKSGTAYRMVESLSFMNTWYVDMLTNTTSLQIEIVHSNDTDTQATYKVYAYAFPLESGISLADISGALDTLGGASSFSGTVIDSSAITVQDLATSNTTNTLSESITISEGNLGVTSRSGTTADSSATSETNLAATGYGASFSDSSITGETQGTTQTVGANFSDTVASSESIGANIGVIQSDNAATSESNAAVNASNTTSSDSSATSETNAGTTVRVGSYSDTAVTSETNVGRVTFNNSITESLATGEVWNGTGIMSQTIADSLAALESFSTGNTAAYTDLISTSETRTAINTSLGNLTDTIATSELLSAINATVAAFSDSLTTGESRSTTLGVVQSDSSVTGETNAGINTSSGSLVDSVATSETNAGATTRIGAYTDTSAASDSSNGTQAAGGSYSDTLATSETVSSPASRTATVTDSTATSENRTAATGYNVSTSDSSATSESLVSIKTMAAAINESLSFSELINAAANYKITNIDTVVLTGTFIAPANAGFFIGNDKSVTGNLTIGVTRAVTKAVETLRTQTASLGNSTIKVSSTPSTKTAAISIRKITSK